MSRHSLPPPGRVHVGVLPAIILVSVEHFKAPDVSCATQSGCKWGPGDPSSWRELPAVVVHLWPHAVQTLRAQLGLPWLCVKCSMSVLRTTLSLCAGAEGGSCGRCRPQGMMPWPCVSHRHSECSAQHGGTHSGRRCAEPSLCAYAAPGLFL